MTKSTAKNIYSNTLRTFAIAAIALLCFAPKANARLTGEADLGYTYFDSKPNDESYIINNAGDKQSLHPPPHQWGSSFSQKYSLLYSKKDKLVNGRLGKYDVALGYEILSFNTNASVSSGLQSDAMTKGHLLYSGSITIDPKEVPIRLTLFSHDNMPGRFTKQGVQSQNSIDFGDFVPAFDLTQNIRAGIHTETGATLIAGVKNGMTNGYNEILRHFPMILLDYRDRIDKDTESDSRLTQLAFVSLNKKENWFHYRYAMYKDNLDNLQSYNESQIQLGTVDQTLQRRWVDFSNWLQISTDALFVNHETPTVENTYQDISLNLFATARRQNWDARMFNTFYRHTKIKSNYYNNPGDTIGTHKVFTYSTTTPLYLSGIINRTTNWDAFIGYDEKHSNALQNRTRINGGYNLYAYTQSPFTLKQGLNIDYATSTEGGLTSDSALISARFETTSTPRFSTKVSLGASNETRVTHYTTRGIVGDFFENDLQGKATYNHNNTLRFSFNQNIKNTFGKPFGITSSLYDSSLPNTYQSPVSTTTVPNQTIESRTSLRADWQASSRLSTNFNLSEFVYLADTGESHTASTIGSGIQYKLNLLQINGDALYEWEQDTYERYNIRTSVKYTYSRNMDMYLNLQYSKAEDKQNSQDVVYGSGLYVEQGVNYYAYKTNGITRKLFEINEQFITGKGVTNKTTYTSAASNIRTNQFSLGIRYYPIRALTLATGTRQSFYSNKYVFDSMYYASIALTYQLFETSLDYTHGKVRSSPDGRIDKRFAVNVKKRF